MGTPSGQSKVGRIMDATTDSIVWNWLAKNVPVLSVLVFCVWFIAERTESPAANAKRITNAIKPLTDEVKQQRVDCRAHDKLEGHPVSITKIEGIEKTLIEVTADVKEVLEIARNGVK